MSGPQKYALLVGVNIYEGCPENSLKGCAFDVRENMAPLLAERGYEPKNIAMMLDSDATKAAELAELRTLIAYLSPGDTLVWWRSSHGTQVPDADGDEKDGLDEALCHHDSLVDWPLNLTTDDELAPIIGAAPRGATIIIGLDECHSGTSTRPLVGPASGAGYRKARVLIPPDGALAAMNLARTRRIGRARHRRGEVIVPSMAEVLLSGCRADQTSADTFEDDAHQGAFTWALGKALRAGAATLGDAHAAALKTLRSGGYDQVPQFEASAERLAVAAF